MVVMIKMMVVMMIQSPATRNCGQSPVRRNGGGDYQDDGGDDDSIACNEEWWSIACKEE